MKSQVCSIVCLLVLAAACGSPAEARPKRSVIYAAAPVVAGSIPLAVSHTLVHENPTQVVRTEQVRSGDHASYSYTSEVKSNPVVHTHTTHTATAVAAAPVVATHHAVAAAPVVATHHTVAAVPAYHYAYAYPSAYPSAYSHYYSPYNYVLGK